MDQNPLDQMVEMAVACLAAGDRDAIGALVGRMARQWPGEPALALCFALSNAAARLEDVIGDARTARAAARAYKLAAVLAADVYAIEATGRVPARADDLLHFWRRVDPWFLELGPPVP